MTCHLLFKGVKNEPEVTMKTPKLIIIPNGDEVTMRTVGVQKSNANLEEKTVKLAGLSSFLSLAPSYDPNQKACVHNLNHLLHAHENLTVTKFNHFLCLLSLENLCLETASSPPAHRFVNPSISPLLFDHPFNLEIVTNESSVVPVSEFTASTGAQLSCYTLQLEKPTHNMEEYSVLEVFEFSGLLQELRSLQFTHPYIEMFEHQHSESLILVVHTGFDGTPVHQHKLSSHTHTKVGFQNYLQFVSEQYSHLIDEAVEENGRRHMAYEQERKALAAQRLKEAEERRKEALATLEEEQVPESAKTKKSGGASGKPNPTLRKGALSNMLDTTPVSSTIDLQRSEAHMQPFQVEKWFTGYDMGDTVLLKESIHTTLFTSDGVQVQSKRHLMTDGAPEPCDVTLLHNGHRVVCTQVWISNSSSLCKAATDTNTGANSPATSIIPQPPPELKCASLKACFNNSLHVSCSHYGPKGNGELPYLPHPPKIPQSDHLQSLHPATQQGVSPKLSKKQQEHQQQLLEQQRAQEALVEKERQVAQMKYQQQYDTLVRNNKYQRLNISTEYGLNIQCHVSLDRGTDTADAADTVSALEGSVIVKQQYETATQLNEHVSKEKCRFYHPDGYVIKCMKDDSVIILNADGTRYRSATSKEMQLFAKYKSTIKEEEDQLKVAQKDDLLELDKAAKKVTSSTKLKSAEKAEKVEKEKNVPPPTPTPAPTSQGKIWAVTTSAGSRYLFEEMEETAPEESPLSPEQENKENIEPVPSPTNIQRIMPLSSIHLLKATDPVTKEVRTVFIHG